MLKSINFFILILWSLESMAQFGPQQIITEQADGSRIICAADLDGDGNVDVLSANKFGNNLTWYKNMDGNGDFGPQNTIAFLTDTIHVHTSDLDGDGDMDVLAVSYFNDLVVWYENLDGLGNFSTAKIISNTVDGAYRVIAADIDGDGDKDVISGSDNTGIAWYENTDGNGNFGPSRVINFAAPSSRSIATADMDNDGDLDVVGATSGTVTVSWYKNLDGLGNFGTQQTITTNGLSVEPIVTIDIDGDGDIDVIAATGGQDKVSWYENLDSLGNFGGENIIIDNLLGAHSIYSTDLDNDGDNDLLATGGGAFDGEVVWIENIGGLGAFGSKNIISAEVQFSRSVIAADIDNDGDMDVIASSQNDDKIAWYENYTILGVEENPAGNIKIYPNPSRGILFIKSKTGNIEHISVLDILGKNVLQLDGNIQEVDISNLHSGVYFLQIITNDGNFVKKIIKN